MTAEVKIRPRGASALEARIIRIALFLYVSMVMCPIRFWAISRGTDNTWVFASNYAAAHGLANGRDIFWTSGPLGYLVFPQNLGGNLSHALPFQFTIWAVLLAILADAIFVARFPLRNTFLMAVCLGLSAPLYWFNYMGLENLLLAGALLLLTVFRWRGGRHRYVAALVSMGIIPLIKLTGGMLAAMALAGFLVDRALKVRSKVWGDVLLAVLVPISVAAAAAILLVGKLDVAKYLKVSLELAGGYSVAMSKAGAPFELLSCLAVLLLIGAVLWRLRSSFPEAARFSFLMLAGPLALSVKHGFVRHDMHIVNFFGFAALALGLILLPVVFRGRQGSAALGMLAAFAIISLFNVVPVETAPGVIGMMTGIRSMAFAAKASGGSGRLSEFLRVQSEPYHQATRIEREIRDVIGDSEATSLSIIYNWAELDGLRWKLYPIVQRYSSYTPYLDGLNADWIRESGPRFLLFDGKTIDQRHILAETPATWLEVYRWYDLRLAGPRNLLLERRAQARFTSLHSVRRWRGSMGGEIAIPPSNEPLFLTAGCGLSPAGKLGSLLLRVPEVLLVSDAGSTVSSRVLPAVLTAPAIVNLAGDGLPELASLFREGGAAAVWKAGKLRLEGPGLRYYGSDCDFALYSP